jgi:hypothetical protein
MNNVALIVKVVESKEYHLKQNLQDVWRDDAPNVSGAI